PNAAVDRGARTPAELLVVDPADRRRPGEVVAVGQAGSPLLEVDATGRRGAFQPADHLGHPALLLGGRHRGRDRDPDHAVHPAGLDRLAPPGAPDHLDVHGPEGTRRRLRTGGLLPGAAPDETPPVHLVDDVAGLVE